MTDAPIVPPSPLADVLLSSLDALVAAGEAETACRLAGQACAALRGKDEAAWRRFNAFLHRAAKYVSVSDIFEA